MKEQKNFKDDKTQQSILEMAYRKGLSLRSLFEASLLHWELRKYHLMFVSAPNKGNRSRMRRDGQEEGTKNKQVDKQIDGQAKGSRSKQVNKQTDGQKEGSRSK